MKKVLAKIQPILVERIFLDLSNPRHEPYKTEAEVIEYLCREEQVYSLARDIAKIGINPLEIFAVIPLDKKSARTQSFVVAEGNRRMCALKLLNDPDLAPAKYRKDFTKLSEESVKIPEVPGIVFEDEAELNLWLERLHGGVQGGVGRKPWSPEQKTRHIGDRKNVLAQSVLDYAEKKGFISSKQRKGKLTTAQRYLGNAFLRDALGLDSSNLDDVARDRPEQDFDILLSKFSNDLVSGKVNSRSNKDEIKTYSRELTANKNISGKRVAPESLMPSPTASKRKRKTPKKPVRPKHVTYEQEISDKLKSIPSYKLETIYYSICDISLEDHTPLISVGVWSFFECLTARCGRNSTTSFPDFLSKQKLNQLGFSAREQVSSIRDAVQRISSYGNVTKHHDTSANFNGEQLANDMDVLKDLILKLADEAK
jgi:hypothetical protein